MQPTVKTCSLEELRKEPWRLRLQADNIAEQLRNLVLKNYHVFIQSNQCAAIVKDDLAKLKEKTTQIEATFPQLQEDCAKFQREVADVVAKHGDIQFVLEHYLQLTELLEIPQLLEACIHNELFDSALDVIQFANELFQNDDIEETQRNIVIDCLVREVAEMTGTMRETLLQKLREDVQLALCVRIVGYLRRLDVLINKNAAVGSLEYENELKEEFLACRNVWLSSLSQGLLSSDPYHYIINVIDIKRTSWFDMITQYSAIFGSENVRGKVDPPLCRWATTTVATFLHTLMKQLPKIHDFSSIATLLEQSLFFGGSLGRVGVDFRAVLVVHFENHVLNLMTEAWRSACRDFQEALQAHSLPFSASCKTPIVMASYSSSANDNEFTNALLSSLNELRLCAMKSLQSRLNKQYQSAIGTLLLTIAQFVEENKLSLHATTDESNRKDALAQSLRAMNEVIRAELIPYLIKCFHRLCPVPSAAALDDAQAIAQEIDNFDEIMREAGLLWELPSDETETQNEIDVSAQAAVAASFDADVAVADTIQ